VLASAICRMNELRSLLMDFSRDPDVHRQEPTNISETIRRAIRAVAVRPEVGRIAITYEHQGLDEGRFEAGQVQRVISNPVLNVCEAVSAISGTIAIKSSGQRRTLFKIVLPCISSRWKELE